MKTRQITLGTLILASTWAAPTLASRAAGLQETDVVIQALVDEMERSMTMQLEDLEPPYFVQYSVDDTTSLRIAASCGGVTSSDQNRSRRLSSEVRVGSYELDNTNFAGGGGGGGFARGRGRAPGGMGRGGGPSLPLDDDYATIREAAWMATDGQYKSAVEALEQKRLYVQDRMIEDRPDDFSPVEPVVAVGPKAVFEADTAKAEGLLRAVSASFLRYGTIQDSGVQLSATATTRYLVNSEGTVLRDGSTRAVLTIAASTQDANGAQLSDRRTYTAESTTGLPGLEELLADATKLAEGLVALRVAPILESYTGPVLFDDEASAEVFQALLAQGVVGRPESVGGGRRRFDRTENLESSLGKRILPRDFQVLDDPRAAEHEGRFLSGSYRFDAEGVVAQRVNLVVDGKLQDLLTCRTPSSTIDGSNGHARGSSRAGVGCLFIESSAGLPADQLKAALLEAAADQDLEYALRITSLGAGARQQFGGRGGMMGGRQRGGMRGGAPGGGQGGSALADPVHLYKVYVADGREERVRGAEFGDLDVRILKDILAAGSELAVSNEGSASILAPSILIEEVDLYPIEQEPGRLPLVAPPNGR